MNNKGEQGKRAPRARARRLGKFWSMLEHFWSILELKLKSQVVRPEE
jgi:hypothetical protein